MNEQVLLKTPDPRPAPAGLEAKQYMAYGLIFGIAGLAAANSATGFAELFKGGFYTPLGILQLLVLVCLVALAFRWITATSHEAELWLTWTDMKSVPRSALGAMLGIAFYLGGSIAFVAKPVLVTAWFTVGTAFSIWTQHTCNRLFSKAHAAPPHQSVPESMKKYWLERPHVVRILVSTLLSAACFGFALFARIRTNHQVALTVTSYVIMLANIIGAEIVIHIWRSARDNQLHATGIDRGVIEGEGLQPYAFLQMFLTILPILSFALQFYFSRKAGTLRIMMHHYAVTFTDWVFIPFNFFVTKLIDWQRGITLYLITAISTTLVLLTHAKWVIDHADPGHMIAPNGVILAAGWVHIGFSIIQMTILVAFVFCRRAGISAVTPTVFALIYFAGLAIGGYVMHGHHLIASDFVVAASGLVFLVLLPICQQVIQRSSVRLHQRRN